jgi:methionyl-tRNA synthetase
MTTFITVAIPYVNATPHLGYAFELIEADLAARARRASGEAVRFLGGTDDHSLKNVLAAEAAGSSTRAFVDEHAERFAALAEPLGLSFDDFIRTSSDPRHRPAVERLWAACDRSGDLYRREYEGTYCVGCERFYEPNELIDGRCPEHGTGVDSVIETNWFFRLSRYQDQLLDLIETNTLLIDPEPFRNEVLAFVKSGLRDISVSRSIERARGWGIGVPGDESQVVYVWFDALTNYISALDFGTDGELYDRWWRHADHRVHVVGKGIQRFHAVYWPAFLLSAGQPVPTRIHVHPYLTVDGAKISKSSGNGPDLIELTDRYGIDALRWWCTRDVSPITDTDFTVDRLIGRANDDLANGIGNAVSRITALVRRHRNGVVPDTGAEPLDEAIGLADAVNRALGDFDRRTATALIADAVAAINRDIDTTSPWVLARHPESADRFDELVDRYARTLVCIADALRSIVPALAARTAEQLDRTTHLPAPEPVFPRIDDVPRARASLPKSVGAA